MTLHLKDLNQDAEVHSVIALPTSVTSSVTAQKNPSRATAYRAGIKRATDVFLVVASAVFVLPLVLILGALVALDGSNPFFLQKRVGRGGRVFRMWKLRTMVPNADRLLEQHLADNPGAHQEWTTTQKLKHDPRITRLGAFLRKTSLDELPQLWNVLKGDMSLVGPRPMMVDQRALYPGQAYYNLRPGITGLWQISDRNECAFHERARYDDEYDRSLSLALDVSVLARTVGVVFRGTGY